MSQDSLQQLRGKILNDVLPLAEKSNMAPEQKFALLVNSARITGDTSKFDAAYEAASSVEDETTKAELLMELLEEVEIVLGSANEEENDESSAENTEHPEASDTNTEHQQI